MALDLPPTYRGGALALSAAGGMLAALGGCSGPAGSVASPSPAPMPEYPPVAEKPEGGARRDVAAVASSGRVAVRQKPQNCCNGRHQCKGQNDCKGKGSCKTDNNACKGQNQCKGQGGCKSCP